MALALDASSPAAVTATDSSKPYPLTTASFTPPAGSVVVVISIGQSSTSGHTISGWAVSDNLGSSLTYTQFAQYGNTSADVMFTCWWAPVVTSAPMTITTTYTESTSDVNPLLLRVLVFTGANTTAPIGATSGGRGHTTNISGATAQYASTVNGSWGWLVYGDWSQSGVPTVPAGETVDSSYNVAGDDTYAIIKQNSLTATAGTTVTMSTSTPTSGLQITWAYFEIVPPGSSGTNFTQNVTDAFSQSDSTVKFSSFFWTDSGAAADLIAKAAAPSAYADPFSFIDSTAKQSGKSLATSFGISDAFSRATTLVRGWTDSIIQSDAFSRAASLHRTLADAITSSESFQAAKVLLRSLADALSPTDAFSRAASLFRSWANPLSPSDSIAKSTARRLSDSIIQSDTLAALKVLIRALSDAVTTADSIVRSTSKALISALSPADIFSRVASLRRSFTDAISESDSLQKLKVLIRNLADSVSIADSVSRFTSKVFLSAITLSEIFSAGSNALTALFSDAVAITDRVSKGIYRTLADSALGFLADLFSWVKRALKFPAASRQLPLIVVAPVEMTAIDTSPVQLPEISITC